MDSPITPPPSTVIRGRGTPPGASAARAATERACTAPAGSLSVLGASSVAWPGALPRDWTGLEAVLAVTDAVVCTPLVLAAAAGGKRSPA